MELFNPTDLNKKINVGIIIVLTLIFVGLKTSDKLDWGWIWVLSPLWIVVGAILGIALVLESINLFKKINLKFNTTKKEGKK